MREKSSEIGVKPETSILLVTIGSLGDREKFADRGEACNFGKIRRACVTMEYVQVAESYAFFAFFAFFAFSPNFFVFFIGFLFASLLFLLLSGPCCSILWPRFQQNLRQKDRKSW